MPNHPAPEYNALGLTDSVTASLHQLKAVLTTLGHVFGGDYPHEDRPEDLQLCLVIQCASRIAERAHLMANECASMRDSVACELMEMSALLNLMDTTHSALDMRIAFSDDIMDGYIDATIHCVDRALAMIAPANASSDLPSHPLAEAELNR